MGDRSMGKKDNSAKSGKQALSLQEKRERAELRQEVYASLTVEEKLARIESRPGSSAKEKARLKKLKK